MVNSEMDKKNFTLFMAILVVMVALVGTDMLGSGVDISKIGRPVVREPFSDADYNVTFKADQILVDLSPAVVEEYEGKFLSVYAYDLQGNHVFKLKRVVNEKILIDDSEAANFNATLSDGIITGIEKASKEASFYQILVDARDNNRFYGLEKCLLGQQCIKICPVAAIEVLIKDTSPQGKGRIIPDIDYNKCIEGGLCATRCPTSLIIVEKNESQ